MINKLFFLISRHREIKGNEEAEKAAKQLLDMSGMTTTRHT